LTDFKLFLERHLLITMSYQTSGQPRRPSIQVVAPSNLPGGYTFQTKYDGIPYDVDVPPGGVKEGDVFEHTFPALGSVRAGEWRDGLFECFRHGICHPMCIMSTLFNLVAVGQIMTRMKLNWKGEEGSPEQVTTTYKKLVLIYIASLVVAVVYNNYNMYNRKEEDPPEGLGYLVYKIVHVAILVYTIIVIARTRAIIRAESNIPEKNNGGCEDIVCATFCQCCTVAQMGRHTANYDVVQARFFTSDGLEHVTVMEV